MKHPGILGRLMILLVLMIFPTLAWADNLTIVDVDTPEKGTPAAEAKVSVYFDLRQGESNAAVTGINADNCKVNIDGKTPEVVKSEIRTFAQGDKGVGILFRRRRCGPARRPRGRPRPP